MKHDIKDNTEHSSQYSSHHLELKLQSFQSFPGINKILINRMLSYNFTPGWPSIKAG